MAEDWRSMDLPENEQAMLVYVEKLTLAAATMTSEDVESLRQVGWKDREILDIALVSAYYNFRCRMADALGVELDERMANSDVLKELERRNVTPVRS